MLLPHQQAFRGLCAFSVNCTFPFKLFSFYLIHKITRGPCCGDHINPLSPFHSVDHACELLQPHGTLLKYQTLMKYQTPHADLFFHSMQSRNRTTVICRISWIKKMYHRYEPQLRNYRGKPMFTTFCLLFPGHLWIRLPLR